MHINSANMISESIRLRQCATQTRAPTLSYTHTHTNLEAFFPLLTENICPTLHGIMFHKHPCFALHTLQLANDSANPVFLVVL